MKSEEESLEIWKEALWGMWLDGMRLGCRPVNLKTMQAAFYAAFDSGRASIDTIKRPRKKKQK